MSGQFDWQAPMNYTVDLFVTPRPGAPTEDLGKISVRLKPSTREWCCSSIKNAHRWGKWRSPIHIVGNGVPR